MIRYVFDEDAPVRIKNAGKANAQAIGETIAKIGQKTGGVPELPAIIEEAKNKKSPLHQHFEWDVQRAAYAHWAETARSLLRLIKVKDEQTGELQPAYINVSLGRDGRSYLPLDRIKKSADLQLAVLKQARNDLEAWTKRYRILADICAEVATIRDRIDQRIAESETRVAA